MLRVVFANRLRHREPVERLAEVDRRPLVFDARRAQDALRHVPDQRLGQVHQVVIVAVGLVELEHRELGVVPRRDALVAEIAVDLEDLFQAADDQFLQIQLRRDAQEQLHVERVVMRHERPRRRAARDRMHHRRFDFEVAALHEELANRLHDLRTLDEHVARRRIGDEVDIALPIALLLVGHPVEFLRQRTQRLRQQPDLRGLHRQLAGLGLEQRARRRRRYRPGPSA